MDRAVDRILQALQQGEPMTIYGDYDVDGTSASSLLYLFLQARGPKWMCMCPGGIGKGMASTDRPWKKSPPGARSC